MESTSNSQGTPRATYARFTEHQIEFLRRKFAENVNPTAAQRLQMVQDNPILQNITEKQIRYWFQNHRTRQRQRQDNPITQTIVENVPAIHILQTKENDLMRRIALRHEEQNNQVTHPSNELISEPAANSPQHSVATDLGTSLRVLTNEIREEFLQKALGDSINWVRIPGIKCGEIPTDFAYISRACIGLAARTCAVIHLDSSKITETLKDRACWSRICRHTETISTYYLSNGEIIEMLYTQWYALTTLDHPRDFWTLRYTSRLADGSLVVCERSLSGPVFGKNAPNSSSFRRAKMLASGFMVRQCESGESTLYIVDHYDLKASSVYMVQSFIETPELLAQKVTLTALGHIELMAKENSGNEVLNTSLRSFSQSLSRGFNNAISAFTEDEWGLDNSNSLKGTSTHFKLTENLGINAKYDYDGVVCVRALFQLWSVSPSMIVRILRDRRSDWEDINNAQSTSSLEAGSGSVGLTMNGDEILETAKFSDIFCPVDAFQSDPCLVQICNGIKDESFLPCSELIFAPRDDTTPDEALLLASGFRVIAVGSNTVEGGNGATRQFANSRSLVVTAFQFPFELINLKEVSTRAENYVQHVISCVKKIAETRIPSGSILVKDSLDAESSWICQSYRSNTGTDLLVSNGLIGISEWHRLWFQQDAILCWCYKGSNLFCSFANRAGLEMLGINKSDMQSISLDMLSDELDEPGKLSNIIQDVMHQGSTCLTSGHFLNPKELLILYEKVVVWKVLNQVGDLHSIAFSFTGWSIADWSIAE